MTKQEESKREGEGEEQEEEEEEEEFSFCCCVLHTSTPGDGFITICHTLAPSVPFLLLFTTIWHPLARFCCCLLRKETVDYQRGLSAWTISVDYQRGLSVWTISVDYQRGLSAWTINVELKSNSFLAEQVPCDDRATTE